MLDNGAFSLWTRARRASATSTVQDWTGFYAWAEPWLDFPTTWAVIPDVIDGDEAANDELVAAWPFGTRGAPVWHMHESVDRLLRLAERWPRVCVGSSGAYAEVGTPAWHRRMHEALDELCGNGPVPVCGCTCSAGSRSLAATTRLPRPIRPTSRATTRAATANARATSGCTPTKSTPASARRAGASPTRS